MDDKNDKIIETMTAALENATSSAITDYIKQNTKIRSSLGLKETIIREELSNCCKWCHDLAGEYEYGTEPSDIYRRHDNCKCIVLFKSAKGKYQDVWNKKEFETQKEARTTREKEINQQKNYRVSGGVSGALDPNEKEADEHAKRYYGLVRKMTTDVTKIANNTGMSEREIEQIKQFLFIEEHDLGEGILERFAPDYKIAESWQRLMNGETKPHDLTLLKHEKLEKELIQQGKTQREAHIEASKKYNYTKEAQVFYAEIKNNNKNR